MEEYEWDLTLAAAHQLGIDARAIAKVQTINTIARLFAGEREKLTLERLISEMCERNDDQYENNETLINAFIKGFVATNEDVKPVV